MPHRRGRAWHGHPGAGGDPAVREDGGDERDAREGVRELRPEKVDLQSTAVRLAFL